MSTRHCGFTAPVASTTVYLFGAVHSTERRRKQSLSTHADLNKKRIQLDRSGSVFFPLTFKFKCKLIRVVECEHLFVRVLLVCIEDQLGGEHKHRKASLHKLRLSILLLGLHWLPLSSLSPSRRRSYWAPLLSTKRHRRVI